MYIIKIWLETDNFELNNMIVIAQHTYTKTYCLHHWSSSLSMRYFNLSYHKYNYLLIENQLFEHCLSFWLHSMSFNHFKMLPESVFSEEISVWSEMNGNLSMKLSEFENSECCCLKKSSNKKGISLKRVTLYRAVLT